MAKCNVYRCPKRATKYMLLKVKNLGRFLTENKDERVHTYCGEHWDEVHKRYWSK